jgi:uncharacterized protein YdeI (YjbR/CyaY-like superfamily)
MTEELVFPSDLLQALSGASLLETFRALPPSHQAEYIRWIDDARRVETRKHRIEGTVSRLSGRTVR